MRWATTRAISGRAPLPSSDFSPSRYSLPTAAATGARRRDVAPGPRRPGRTRRSAKTAGGVAALARRLDKRRQGQCPMETCGCRDCAWQRSLLRVSWLSGLPGFCRDCGRRGGVGSSAPSAWCWFLSSCFACLVRSRQLTFGGVAWARPELGGSDQSGPDQSRRGYRTGCFRRPWAASVTLRSRRVEN